MTDRPSLSVASATHNCGSFLADAMKSAWNQTLPQHEVIVVDAGSTDDTSAIFDAFGDRIRSVKQAKAGISKAHNWAGAADPEEMRWDRVAGRTVSSVRRKILGPRPGAAS